MRLKKDTLYHRKLIESRWMVKDLQGVWDRISLFEADFLKAVGKYGSHTLRV